MNFWCFICNNGFFMAKQKKKLWLDEIKGRLEKKTPNEIAQLNGF